MGALHNVAVTLGAVRRVVDDGQAVRRLGLGRRAERDAPVGQHLVAAHRDAGPVRRLRRQGGRRRRRRGRLRAGAGAARRRRAGARARAHHARSARAGAVRAVQAARRPRARHARARVKVTRLCRPQHSVISYKTQVGAGADSFLAGSGV